VREYLVLLKKELRSITKEKTIMLAIVVQFLIASLSSVILEGVMTFYDPNFIGWSTSEIRVGYAGNTDTPLFGYLQDRKIVTRSFSELANAEAAFHAGQIDAILFMPDSQSDTVNMKLFLPKMEARRTFILVMLDEPLKRYEDYLRQANGVLVNYKSFDSTPFSSYEFLYTALIPILMLFPALVAGSIVIDSISEEFENKTLDTLISTPISARQVFASKVSAAVITAVVQIVMWVGLLSWNGIIIEGLALVLILAMSYSVTISLGAAIIAIFFKDRQRAQFTYSMILIAVGAASYFLNPSPFELLTKLSSGAPNISVPGFVLYAVLPVAIGLIFFHLSERRMSAGS
jgi:ABC-2 type transport system permease protein